MLVLAYAFKGELYEFHAETKEELIDCLESSPAESRTYPIYEEKDWIDNGFGARPAGYITKIGDEFF